MLRGGVGSGSVWEGYSGGVWGYCVDVGGMEGRVWMLGGCSGGMGGDVQGYSVDVGGVVEAFFCQK